MDILWQQIVIIVAIVLALVYLVWRFVHRRRFRGQCDNCPVSRILRKPQEKITKR